MEAFDYSPLAGRVVFGSGTIARVAAEVEALSCSRAFVLSDAHHAASAALRVRGVLGDRAVGLSTACGLRLPPQIGWRELFVVAIAASAGVPFGLFFATAVFPVGPVLAELKMGTLLTVAGALVAIAVAWLLGVGRFARRRPA